MFSARLQGYVLGGTVFLLSAAFCQAQSIRVLPPDEDNVMIHGRAGDDSSFSKRITLLSDQSITDIIFHPTDLQRVGGGAVIPRTQIQVVSPSRLALTENTPEDLDFRVTGVRKAGTYKGTIYFFLPRHGTTDAAHVPVELIADATGTLMLRKGSESVRIQIVDCNRIGCLLSKLLQPNAARKVYEIPFENPSSEAFSVDGSLAASGEQNWGDVGDSLSLTVPTVVSAKPIVNIRLSVSNTSMAPDHYVGDIQLRLPGQDTALKVPLEVNVKTGPIIPLLVLLIGVLIGRLLKYMKDKGTPQSDLLLQLHQLERRALRSPQDEQLLWPMFDEANQSIEQLRLADAQTDLAKINNLLTLLSRLRYLEAALACRKNEGDVTRILDLIAQARATVQLGNDPTPIANEIEALVEKLPAASEASSGVGREMMIVQGVSRAVDSLMKPQPVAKPTRTRRFIALITGYSESARAELTLWFLRPTLWLLLVVGLLAVGLQQLYLKNPTFGATPFDDYFGLFIWATSADVVSRTLSTLR